MRGEECGERKHHNLLVWQESVNLVLELYKVTDSFPKNELYGLTNQIRRAAVSVPSNIAEGAGRSSQKEFLQFLHIARGSLCELETQIFISKKLGYMTNSGIVLNKIPKIFRLLNGLINSVKNKV